MGVQRYRNEHTIASSCQIGGRGYWTGQKVEVTIHPASVGTGVIFTRVDLPGGPSCPARSEYRVDAALRTNLQRGQARFEMVEHAMAAVAALEIDNCIIEIDGMEFPALDGSCQAYVEALSKAGLIIQAASKQRVVIDQRYRVGTSESWIEAIPTLREEASYEFQLCFDDETLIAPQTYQIRLTPDRFIREVASARTFVTEQQATQIRASGMAKHVTNQDLLVIGSDGPIDNSFRFANECARHKTLDLIGDLALAGVEIVGQIKSFRGGHSLNGQMAFLLSEIAKSQSKKNPLSRQWKAA